MFQPCVSRRFFTFYFRAVDRLGSNVTYRFSLSPMGPGSRTAHKRSNHFNNILMGEVNFSWQKTNDYMKQ